MKFILPILFAAVVVGCESEKGDSDAMRQRQDAAMKDPYSYGPAEGKTADPSNPVQGSKRDDSAKGDWNRFWNP